MLGRVSKQHCSLAPWLPGYYFVIRRFDCPVINTKLALSSNCLGRYLGVAFYSADAAIKDAAERNGPEPVSHRGSIVCCISQSTQRNSRAGSWVIHSFVCIIFQLGMGGYRSTRNKVRQISG